MESTTLTASFADRVAAIDIVLVSAYPIYRDGLRLLLEEEPGFTVVGAATNADNAVNAIRDLKPHVVIVILSGRPLMRMVQALHDLSAGGTRTRTILLMTGTEQVNLVQPQELGVAEILCSQTTSSQRVIDSVRRVAAGDCWLERGPFDHLVEATRHLQTSSKVSAL